MDVNALIKETANEFVDSAKKDREASETGDEVVEEVQQTSVDNYQTRQRAKMNMTPRARGADARLSVDLGLLEQQNISYAFKKAKDEVEGAERSGDRERARLLAESYMENTLLPTIDALVGLNGAAALLSNQRALDTLDGYALIPGRGSRGYTASLISSLYDTTALPSDSDSYVRYYIGKLGVLCADAQIRAAVGLATQLKDSIDKGEHRASPEDYEKLQKVIFKSY